MLYPQATEFPRLTESEEANIILQDTFQYDADGMDAMLQLLCEYDGIAFDWEANGDEIDQLIIDNEDELISMYQSYLKVKSMTVSANEEETPETEEDPEIIEEEEDTTQEPDEDLIQF